MSQESIEHLFERWQDDEDFRTALREDPRAAVASTGLELSEDEWAAIDAVDFSLDDEELAERFSMGNAGMINC